jgi:hypothetical protein
MKELAIRRRWCNGESMLKLNPFVFWAFGSDLFGFFCLHSCHVPIWRTDSGVTRWISVRAWSMANWAWCLLLRSITCVALPAMSLIFGFSSIDAWLGFRPFAYQAYHNISNGYDCAVFAWHLPYLGWESEGRAFSRVPSEFWEAKQHQGHGSCHRQLALLQRTSASFALMDIDGHWWTLMHYGSQVATGSRKKRVWS